MATTAMITRGESVTDGAMVAQQDPAFWEVMQRVVTEGDLTGLSPEHKTKYYRYVCQSVGLNAATQPFGYIKTQGKLTLYANRNATDQLRKIHHINLEIVLREKSNDEKGDPVYTVMARATMPDGREDESIALIPIKGLGGEEYCNALMKCETKAKRRVTLSAVGLSLMDELEAESIRGAERFTPDEVEREGFVLPSRPTLPAETRAKEPAPPAVPKPSNVHQHAQIRSLAEHGFPLAKALAAHGYESIEELSAEQARDLIIRGRAEVRTPPSARATTPTGPAPVVEHVTPDAPFRLTGAQISLFWAAGADNWSKDEKREALALLFPLRVGQDGTVDIRDLSRGEFDDMIALFNEEREIVYDKDGAAYLRPAGPPADES